MFSLSGKLSRLRRTLHHTRPKLLEWLSISMLVLLIIAPLSILVWIIFSTDTFLVQTLTIVDAREHTEVAIRERISNLLGKNVLLIDTQSAEFSIAASVPQIRTVRIERKLPSALKITAQEKTPTLLLLSGGKYHFVDEQGIAYEEARLDTLPGVVLPVIKNTGEQTDVRLGLPAVSGTFVSFILGAQKEIPGLLSTEIIEFRIPSLAAKEVHVLLSNNWLIRFDTSRPLAAQIDILKRLLAHTISTDDQGKIEYIDMRIENRVYYKLRQAGTATKE